MAAGYDRHAAARAVRLPPFEHHDGGFFGILLAALAASLRKDIVLYGRLPQAANLVFHAVFMAGCASAIWVRRPRHHQLLAAGAPLSIAVYAVLLFWRLG